METSKQTFIFIIINILISVLSGILVFLFTGNIYSYIAGFCTFFALSLIRLQIINEKSNSLYSRFLYLINNFEINDKFSELYLIYAMKSISNIDRDVIHVNKDEVFNFWYEGTSRIQQSSLILTYASPKATWDLGWNDIAIGVQQERIINGCKIERIFIVDDNEDLNLYAETIKEQNRIGVKVRKILKPELLKNEIIQEAINEIGTIDFSLNDQNWIRRVYLDKNRKIKKADATRNKKLIEKARLIINEARKRSVPWNV